MKKVTKEVLDQTIYDLGWEKALNKWQLSDLQAENILFKRVPKERPENDIKKARNATIEIDQDKAEIIWMVISKNYKALYKLYVRNSDTINIRSETTEDKLHNAFIKIIQKLDRFIYIDESTTLEYIKSRLFFEKRTDKTIDYRLNKEISFIDNSETIINTIPNDNN